MHRMSFEIGKEAPRAQAQPGILSVIILIATAMILAWVTEPVISALLR